MVEWVLWFAGFVAVMVYVYQRIKLAPLEDAHSDGSEGADG